MTDLEKQTELALITDLIKQSQTGHYSEQLTTWVACEKVLL